MNSSLQVVLIVCVVAFFMYRRIRRNVGWQQWRPKRLVVRSVLLCVVGVLFLVIGGLHPISIISDAVGVLLGIVLAYVGGTLTRFEHRGGQLQYLPNPWLGGIVTVLFVVRMGYRLYEMFSSGDQGMNGFSGDSANPFSGSTGGSPWTTGLILIMFAYYVTYSMLLLRSSGRLSASRTR